MADLTENEDLGLRQGRDKGMAVGFASQLTQTIGETKEPSQHGIHAIAKVKSD